MTFLCISLSSAKASQGDSWRGGHTAEVNGPAERRKKSCALRSSQEAEQVKVLLPAFYCLQDCCGCLHICFTR